MTGGGFAAILTLNVLDNARTFLPAYFYELFFPTR